MWPIRLVRAQEPVGAIVVPEHNIRPPRKPLVALPAAPLRRDSSFAHCLNFSSAAVSDSTAAPRHAGSRPILPEPLSAVRILSTHFLHVNTFKNSPRLAVRTQSSISGIMYSHSRQNNQYPIPAPPPQQQQQQQQQQRPGAGPLPPPPQLHESAQMMHLPAPAQQQQHHHHQQPPPPPQQLQQMQPMQPLYRETAPPDNPTGDYVGQHGGRTYKCVTFFDAVCLQAHMIAGCKLSNSPSEPGCVVLATR